MLKLVKYCTLSNEVFLFNKRELIYFLQFFSEPVFMTSWQLKLLFLRKPQNLLLRGFRVWFVFDGNVKYDLRVKTRLTSASTSSRHRLDPSGRSRKIFRHIFIESFFVGTMFLMFFTRLSFWTLDRSLGVKGEGKVASLTTLSPLYGSHWRPLG